MLSVLVRDESANGEVVGLLALGPKTFASGKTGYHGQCKLVIGGQRFQVQAQAVLIAPRVGENGRE